MRISFVLAFLLGCAQDHTGTISASLTSTNVFTPAVLAKPAQSAQLLVTITAVKVHVAGDDDETTNDNRQHMNDKLQTDDDGGWFTVFSGSQQLDLLNVAADRIFLGSVAVPAGHITQIRLILSSVTLIVDGKSITVTCPSCSESGLKIDAGDDVMVTSGGHMMLTLDVDVNASLALTNGEFVLSPVIHVSEAEDD
jgi:hypothetical protein